MFGFSCNAANQIQIGLSHVVRLEALIDAAGTSFTAVGKHFQGNRYFGVDSDITTTYYLSSAMGTVLAAGDCPVPKANVNNILNAGYRGM